MKWKLGNRGEQIHSGDYYPNSKRRAMKFGARFSRLRIQNLASDYRDRLASEDHTVAFAPDVNDTSPA